MLWALFLFSEHQNSESTKNDTFFSQSSAGGYLFLETLMKKVKPKDFETSIWKFGCININNAFYLFCTIRTRPEKTNSIILLIISAPQVQTELSIEPLLEKFTPAVLAGCELENRGLKLFIEFWTLPAANIVDFFGSPPLQVEFCRITRR